jgi:hypothetical protein
MFKGLFLKSTLFLSKNLLKKSKITMPELGFDDSNQIFLKNINK